MVKAFAMDGGRAAIKTAGGAVKSEDEFVHAAVPLSDAQFRQETQRAGAPLDDYYTVNGLHYVIGRRAQRAGFKVQLGAKRYVETYYGVFGAIAMARAFQKSTRNVFWVGTHAPEDKDYTDDLLRSICQTWTVEWKDRRFTFDVVDGTTLDEPLAGYYNAVLRADGLSYQNKAIMNGVTLVLDTGGYTTDGGAIDAGGDIDYSTFESARIGVLNAVEQFGSDFRADNPKLLKGVDLDTTMLHTALRTGRLDLRGLGEFDVSQHAYNMRRELANQVSNFYDTFGGAANYNTLLLTGGGAALLQAEIRQTIIHNNIVLADKTSDTLQRANARGALKWYKMHESLGTFE